MKIRVATFWNPRLTGDKPKRSHISAYTRDYNAAWEGCVIYEIDAANGTEAKAIAIGKRLNDLQCQALNA